MTPTVTLESLVMSPHQQAWESVSCDIKNEATFQRQVKGMRGGVGPNGPRPEGHDGQLTNDTVLRKTGPDHVHSWEVWPSVLIDKKTAQPTCKANT